MLEVNKVYNESCMDTLDKMESESVDLIIADPPYFNKSTTETWDNQWKSEKEYFTWCEEWIHKCFRVLKENGSFYCWQQDINFVINLGQILSKYFSIRTDIIWNFATGRPQKTCYRKEHEILLFCTKTKNNIFNTDDIRIPYDVPIEKDKRKNPKGKTCGTVWRHTRIMWNHPENVGHPTQKPLELCERIIKASSDEESLVYVPFAGGGSEILSCIHNDRNYIASEINSTYIEEIILPRIGEAI